MSTGEMEDHLLGVDETWFFVVRGHGNAAIAQHTHTHTHDDDADDAHDKQNQYNCAFPKDSLASKGHHSETHTPTPTTNNIVPVVIVFNHEIGELGLGHFDAHCHSARLHLPCIEVAASVGVKELEHLARVSLDLRLGALHRPSAGETRRPSPGRYVCVRVCKSSAKPRPKQGAIGAGF